MVSLSVPVQRLYDDKFYFFLTHYTYFILSNLEFVNEDWWLYFLSCNLDRATYAHQAQDPRMWVYDRSSLYTPNRGIKINRMNYWMRKYYILNMVRSILFKVLKTKNQQRTKTLKDYWIENVILIVTFKINPTPYWTTVIERRCKIELWLSGESTLIN